MIIPVLRCGAWFNQLMNEREAWYILRCTVALAQEGIGAVDPQPEDAETEREAFALAGHRLTPYERDEIGYPDPS